MGSGSPVMAARSSWSFMAGSDDLEHAGERGCRARVRFRTGVPIGGKVQYLSLKHDAVAKMRRCIRVHLGELEHATTVAGEAVCDRERRVVRLDVVRRAGAGRG